MESQLNSEQLPPNFKTIISDWTKDLSNTFPEYEYLWTKWSNPHISESEILQLYNYCLTVYPERFFDILYQNQDLFDLAKSSEINTCFLPDVEFKLLFNCSDISETTSKTMWKYLQLVLFTIVGSIHDKSKFGDSANMFADLGEDELHSKLHEAMSNMGDFFQNLSDINNSTDESTSSSYQEQDSHQDNESNQPPKMDQMPNADNLHGHLKDLFNGKIGALAKELAEEISEDMSELLGKDGENIKSTADVLKSMMKNPTKITGLIKTVSNKLQQKMNSGDISQDELMREATNIISKMKGMGQGQGQGQGQDDFQEMFKNMAKGMGLNIPKNAKMDMNALDRMTSTTTMKDRLRNKMMEKKAAEEVAEIAKQKVLAEQIANYKPYDFSTDEIKPKKKMVFKVEGEETQLTSSIHTLLPSASASTSASASIQTPPSDKKKNKNKKKK